MRGSPAVEVAVAALLDRYAGELPDAVHPVVWMGRLIDALYGNTGGEQRDLGRGIAATVALLLTAGAAGVLVDRLSGRLGDFASLARGAALSTLYSSAGLARAAGEVESELHQGDVAAARLSLRALVSRDPNGLDAAHIRSAVIESIAENTVDSVVAPLFWYALGGLPAAAIYRAVNTADAMVGYRGRYEYLGKAAARLDDVLNAAPARLAARTMIALCGLAGGSPRGARIAVSRWATTIESPNAGWPMSATAGAYGVTLEKVGHYRIVGGPRSPGTGTVHNAVRLMTLTSLTTLCAAAIVRAVLRGSDA